MKLEKMSGVLLEKQADRMDMKVKYLRNAILK